MKLDRSVYRKRTRAPVLDRLIERDKLEDIRAEYINTKHSLEYLANKYKVELKSLLKAVKRDEKAGIYWEKNREAIMETALSLVVSSAKDRLDVVFNNGLDIMEVAMKNLREEVMSSGGNMPMQKLVMLSKIMANLHKIIVTPMTDDDNLAHAISGMNTVELRNHLAGLISDINPVDRAILLESGNGAEEGTAVSKDA